jgi:hypothetical protein
VSEFWLQKQSAQLKKLWKNLQNAAYPEIVFCYIPQKFAYFILPHIVLYFIFCHGFFVGIVSQRAHKVTNLFRLYFFSCHVLCLLFCFNAQADYYILILAWKKKDFHFTAPSKGLFCFNALSPTLRGHGDSQTIIFFSPKTPPRHFHHQKVLCNEPSQFVQITLHSINTPIRRSPLLIQYWRVTWSKQDTSSRHPLTTIGQFRPSNKLNVKRCKMLQFKRFGPDSKMSGTTRRALNGHNSINNNDIF